MEKNTLLKVYSVSQSEDNKKFSAFSALSKERDGDKRRAGGWFEKGKMEICRVK